MSKRRRKRADRKQRRAQRTVSEKPVRRNLFRGLAKPFVRGAKAAKAEFTTYKPLKAIGRREALARIGTGTALAAGTAYGARKLAPRIPLLLGAKKQHSALIVFGGHDTVQDAKVFIETMNEAKRKGRPFHVFFRESALESSKGFAREVARNNANLEAMARDCGRFVMQGHSSEQAIQVLREKYRKLHPKNTDFYREIDIHLAIEGIKVIPIEKYSPETAQAFARTRQEHDRKDKEATEKYMNGESLLSIQQTVLEREQTMHSVCVQREARIAGQLEKRFEDAKEMFPELKDKKRIRALGQLGLSHREVYFDFDHLGSRVRLEQKTISHGFSVKLFALANSISGKKPGPREARLIVLGNYADANIETLLKNDKRVLARKAFTRAIGMPQKEFEELSNLTQRIKKDPERSAFIMNYLLGQRIFH